MGSHLPPLVVGEGLGEVGQEKEGGSDEEASRRLEKWKPLEGRTVSDFFRTVVDEIGLKIVPA